MASFDITKYRQMFLDEAEELFETIDSILLEAEENGDMDNDTVNSLFRSVHTLKGNSASVELAMFAALAHELEFFMDRLRKGELKFEEGMAGLLIEGVDTLKEVLELELADDLDSDFYSVTKSNLLHKLETFSEESGELLAFDKQEQENNDYFGLLLPVDEKGLFGPVAGTMAKALSDEWHILDNDISHDTDNTAQNNLSSEENDFGFFDDESFGLFDDNIISVKKPGTIVSVSEDDDFFGLFDNQEPVDIQTSTLRDTSISKKVDVLQTENISLKSDKKFKSDSGSNSIRVDLSKIDGLMNNIGELVIAHSMLTQYTSTMEDQKIKSDLSERLDLIDRHIRELQESVMSVRMVPMETVFSKFPKVIRDTAKKLDKKIEFRHSGESVEIDKAMIEGLTDPLMHIVRNAMDHGIESPDVRRKAGKNDHGTLMMSAEQANGQMIIKIQDDGGGINLTKVTAKAIENGVIEEYQASQMSREDKAMLIFAPGLSTADAVTDISGRGVGMDVVMSNIKKLGGTVKVDTEEGYGSTFTIALPLTLAILDGLNIRIGTEQFVLPLSVIIESLNPDEEMIKQIGDRNSEVLMLRNEFIPIVRLHSIFNVEPEYKNLKDGLLIVVRSGTQKIAVFVDEFMNQQQFVIKPLDRNFRNARGIGGATVRGDGTIGLIIDTMNIMEKS